MEMSSRGEAMAATWQHDGELYGGGASFVAASLGAAVCNRHGHIHGGGSGDLCGGR